MARGGWAHAQDRAYDPPPPPPPPPPPSAAGVRAASRRRAPSTRATRAASLRRRSCATCSATARSRRRSARPASAQRSASAPTPHRLWRSARPRAMASSRAPRLCTIGETALWHPRWIGQRCSPPRSARTRARQHGQRALARLAARCPRGHPPPGSPHPPTCAQTDGEASRPNGEASPRGLPAVEAAAALWCQAKVADPVADYLYP